MRQCPPPRAFLAALTAQRSKTYPKPATPARAGTDVSEGREGCFDEEMTLRGVCAAVLLVKACVETTRATPSRILQRHEAPHQEQQHPQQVDLEASRTWNATHVSLRRLKLASHHANLSLDKKSGEMTKKKHLAARPMGLDVLETFRILLGGALLAAVFYWCRTRQKKTKRRNAPRDEELEPLLLQTSPEHAVSDDELDSLHSRRKIEEIIDDDLWTSIDDIDDDPPRRPKRKRRHIPRLRPAYRRDDAVHPPASAPPAGDTSLARNGGAAQNGHDQK